MFSIRWPKAVNRKLLEASANADGPGLSVLLTAMADIEHISTTNQNSWASRVTQTTDS